MRCGRTLILVLLSSACGTRAASPPALGYAAVCEPSLPDAPLGYSDVDAPIPEHFFHSTEGTVAFSDNTPPDNRITNAGATLGRVLFYDIRLSGNNRVSCGS